MGKKRAILVLEDGTKFEGTSFGASGEVFAEIVFNTSMTGYQEILTDQSYCGQMVVMTYPLIGNYGINEEDEESIGPQVSGFLVKELSSRVSNWRSKDGLSNYLAQHGIMGLEGVDTRAIVLHIREKGAMRAGISTEDFNPESMLEKVLKSPPMEGQDLVGLVTTKSSYIYEPRREVSLKKKKKFKVAVFDFGIKRNILELLNGVGLETIVLPATTSAQEVDKLKPDGVFLANGPGDPASLDYIITEIKQLIGKYPIFGICLGHQLLGLALGGKTYKLKFGHRGANHPVRDEATGRIEITAQNHGFCVDPDSLDLSKIEITHWNLNDHTVEGLRHKEYPLFCVQYHPEASPGPHDSPYLFERFRQLIEENRV